MGKLATRVERLESRLASPAPPCGHPWHQPDIGPRLVDYRRAIAPLQPGYVAPAHPPVDACPSCGMERLRVEIRGIEVPHTARPWPLPAAIGTNLQEGR